MTVLSMKQLPAALLMTTALAWGIPAHAAGLGVGVGVGVSADASLGASGVLPAVRTGSHSGISSDTRARAMAGVQARGDAQGGMDRPRGEGRSGAALSAVTGAQAEGATSVGSQVRSAVAVDGRVRSVLEAPAR